MSSFYQHFSILCTHEADKAGWINGFRNAILIPRIHRLASNADLWDASSCFKCWHIHFAEVLPAHTLKIFIISYIHNINSSPQCRIYTSVHWFRINSDNGLSPGRRQAIIWFYAGILLIRPIGTNFQSKVIYFHSRKCIWICHLRNGAHFLADSMC